jgi:hypothetical protein
VAGVCRLVFALLFSLFLVYCPPGTTLVPRFKHQATAWLGVTHLSSACALSLCPSVCVSRLPWLTLTLPRCSAGQHLLCGEPVDPRRRCGGD